jgi:hypothetical protein
MRRAADGQLRRRGPLDSFRDMGRLAPGLVLALVLTSSCSLDWTIGGADGGGAEAGAREASTDSHAPPVDTGTHESGTPDVVDSASMDVAPSCATLRGDVAAARAAAVACPPPSGGDCASHVNDQCGCKVFVAQPSSAQTASYKAAINDLIASGCALGCGSCPSPPQVGAECLPSSGDSGIVDVCTPYS